MIECIRFKSYVDGNLQGFADIKVHKWGVEIPGCKLCRFDGRRVLFLPSEKFVDSEGKTKSKPFMKFTNKEHYYEFCNQAIRAIDDWCKKNPHEEEKPSQDQPFDDSECPF